MKCLVFYTILFGVLAGCSGAGERHLSGPYATATISFREKVESDLHGIPDTLFHGVPDSLSLAECARRVILSDGILENALHEAGFPDPNLQAERAKFAVHTENTDFLIINYYDKNGDAGVALIYNLVAALDSFAYHYRMIPVKKKLIEYEEKLVLVNKVIRECDSIIAAHQPGEIDFEKALEGTLSVEEMAWFKTPPITTHELNNVCRRLEVNRDLAAFLLEKRDRLISKIETRLPHFYWVILPHF